MPEWDEAIARHDVVVVSRDLLWRIEVMNAIDLVERINVDSASTLLEATTDLDPTWPAVVVVGPSSVEETLDQIAEFRTTDAETRVLVAFDDTTDAAPARLAEAGICDTIDSPSDIGAIVDAVVATLSETRTDARSERADHRRGEAVDSPTSGPDRVPGRLVIVTAGKGGQGTTTVALNLAAAMAQQEGTRVMLVEGDPSFGDISLALGIPVTATEGDPLLLADHPERLDLHHHVHPSSGLDVIIPPRGEDPLQPLPTETLLAVLSEALLQAEVVVLDARLALVATSGIVPDAAELLLVSAPGVRELKNTLIAREVLDPPCPAGLVLNRVPKHLTPRDVDIEDAVGLPVLARLRDDEALDRQPVGTDPIVLASPHHPFSKEIRALANQLLSSFA